MSDGEQKGGDELAALIEMLRESEAERSTEYLLNAAICYAVDPVDPPRGFDLQHIWPDFLHRFAPTLRSKDPRRLHDLRRAQALLTLVIERTEQATAKPKSGAKAA